MEMQASQPAKGTHNSLSLSVGGSPSAPVLMKPEDEVDAPAAEPSSSSSASTAPKTSPLLNLFASVSKHASSLKELPTPLSKRLHPQRHQKSPSFSISCQLSAPNQ
jgi:hypothetical protein